jgi:hypothetical protein
MVRVYHKNSLKCYIEQLVLRLPKESRYVSSSTAKALWAFERDSVVALEAENCIFLQCFIANVYSHFLNG